jgi:hypothetical protein
MRRLELDTLYIAVSHPVRRSILLPPCRFDEFADQIAAYGD